jgi:hypothetical protein
VFPLLSATADVPKAEDVFRLIRANDLTGLKQVASNPATVNLHDSLGVTPLHYAALYGSVDSVRILLKYGANPNAKNSADATPLIFGAYNLDKTRLLVDAGADLAAGTAAGRSDVAAIQILLEKGADPRYLNQSNSNALMESFDQ